MHLQSIINLISVAATPALANPGSNFNISDEFAMANGCDAKCQGNIKSANQADLRTFGQDFNFEFYATAANFSGSDAGDILKVHPLDPKPLRVRSGTSVYLIQYTSRDLDGSIVPATGFIALPFTALRHGKPSQRYPLVAYAHGTSGLYQGCAPSNSPSLYDYDSWQLLTERGYAVVGTDYVGLGNNYTQHKYCSFLAQANDVYYSTIAAKKAFNIFSDEWVAVGHSQGGGTVWKLSESELVKNDDNFLGTVALAPATRLWDMFLENLKAKAFMGYAAYHAKAMQRIMPSYNLSVLGDKLRKRMVIADKAQLCFSGLMSLSADLTNDEIVSSEGIKTDDPLFSEWQETMAPASTPGSCSSQPVLVIQGLNDSSVLAQVTRDVYRRACAAGSKVHLSEYPAMEHSPIIAAAAPEWISWIDSRFSGDSTSGDCSMATRQPFDITLVKAPTEDL